MSLALSLRVTPLAQANCHCQQFIRLASNSSLLSVSLSNGAANITLTSPKTRNSLSLEMMKQLHHELVQAHRSPSTRCIVIRGEGPAFSSGHNLKEMTTAEGRSYHEEIFDHCNKLMLEIVKAPVPVIAAVDGVAAAAGCQLVATCDMAVATEKSTFSTPGSSVGLFCSTPGVPLARAVPRKISAYMLLTGLPITASDALQAGLINKVAKEKSDLEAEVEAIVKAIQSKPRGVVALGKRFFYTQLELGLSDALREGGKVMVDNLSYRDAQEGIKAFKEKSKPTWSHSDEKVH